ncbi:MAG: hypothetical protein Q9172_005236 [Xanthocarpia lactea]
MAFLVLQLLTTSSLLSLIRAIPNDPAHYRHRNNIYLPETSTLTPNLPKTTVYAPEPSSLSTSYHPESNSIGSGHPRASNGAIPPEGPQKYPHATGLYPGPRQSYPLYQNISSTPGPTASYGTAASSGLPWNNYTLSQQSAGDSTARLSAPSNCPLPSTVTIQNTVTAPPVTITVSPITVTVTSTVSTNPEPSLEIKSTVTITTTTTLCAGAGQNTDLGDNGPFDVNSKAGVEQSVGGFSVNSGSPETSVPLDGKVDTATATSRPIPSFIASGSYSPDFGSENVTPTNQPPFVDSTGYQALSFPEGTASNWPTGNLNQQDASVEQPPVTSLPSGTGSDAFAAASDYPGSREGPTPTTVPYLMSNHSAVNSNQGYGQASARLGTQGSYTPTQPPSAVSSSEGRGSTEPQMLPEHSTSQVAHGSGPLIPGSSGPDESGSGSDFIATSDASASDPGTTSAAIMPERPPSNAPGSNDMSNSAPHTMSSVIPPKETSAAYGSGGGHPISSNPTHAGSYGMPPFVNSTTSVASRPVLGTGVPYQARPNTVPASENLVSHPPAGTTSSESPPFVDFKPPMPQKSTLGTGVRSRPVPSMAPASQGSGLPLLPTASFPPHQPPPYQTPFSNATDTTQLLDIPTTSGGNTIANQTPSDTGILYTTMTQEVVPYPVEPAINSSSTQVITIKLYNNSPPKTDGVIPVSQGDTGGSGDGLGSTSATSSDSNPLPTSSQPQDISPGTNTTSSTTALQSLPTTTPTISSAAKGDNSVPTPLPPPPPASANTNSPEPFCIPSQENQPVKVDFNLLQPNVPVPRPHESLIYTGFEFSTESPSPHLTALASTVAKTISIAPSAKHFNLSSIALACGAPPCDITMWGTKVVSTTAQGAPAGTLLNSRTRVEAKAEGESAYTVLEGLAEKGWTEMEKISFVAVAVGGEGEEGMGVGIDDLEYSVRVEKGCDGEEGKGEEVGIKVEKRMGYRRRIRRV